MATRLSFGCCNYSGCRSRFTAIISLLRKIANVGLAQAIEQLPELAQGLNVADGEIIHAVVAEAYGKH